MVRKRLRLCLYAMDNEPIAPTLSQEAHRATTRRLIEELVADIEGEMLKRAI